MAMSMYVCLSVCSHSSKSTSAELHQIFVHVTYGPCSVFLRRRCDTLCTSGYVDDVMFSSRGAWGRIKHDVVFRMSSPGGGTS